MAWLVIFTVVWGSQAHKIASGGELLYLVGVMPFDSSHILAMVLNMPNSLCTSSTDQSIAGALI